MGKLKLRRHEGLWQWFIYAIVAGIDRHDFIVKIGRTENPRLRYGSLLTGIPFPSTMLYAPVRTRARMIKLERTLHLDLAEYNTRGEWFRFNSETKGLFHDAVRRRYFEAEGESLSWLRVSDKDAMDYMILYRRGSNVRRIPGL